MTSSSNIVCQYRKAPCPTGGSYPLCLGRHKGLIITIDNAIVGTSDGVSFAATAIDQLALLTSYKPIPPP